MILLIVHSRKKKNMPNKFARISFRYSYTYIFVSFQFLAQFQYKY